MQLNRLILLQVSNMKEVIQEIEQEILKKFKNEATGHDWYHIDRVRKNALKIHEKEGGDSLVVELAALLHDISDHKFNGGDFDLGASIAKEMMVKYGVDESTIDAVTYIVRNVSYKGSGVADTMESLEGRIVQDADRLDAIGAIGIARTFAYGGSVGSPIYEPEILPKTNQTKESYVKDRSHTVNHFYEKLLLLKDRMHTDTAKKMAMERTQFMEDFLLQFYKEWKVE